LPCSAHLARPFGEQDDRNSLAVLLARQSVHDLLHARQRKAPVVVALERGAPGVENLDRLGSGLDLRIEVVGRHPRNLAEQFFQRGRFLLCETLDDCEVAAGSTLDHIGAHRPGAA
jgi:hypothetical protein